MDVTDQPKFINAVCTGLYNGNPEELLKLVNSIETKLGRKRRNEQRRGPRAIDIDILLFGDSIINRAPELIIPHSRLKERRFALQPMLELVPDLADPVTGKPFSQFLDKLSGQGIYYFRPNSYI
jgi:2-amino-4-hydroxy-6-hydroxymethyldihydropteridine diphosphokinase